jgi:adenylate cyclase
MTIRGNRQYLWLAALLSAWLLIALCGMRMLQPLEDRLTDSLLKLHAQSGVPDPDIVIIDIDERSLAAMSETVGRWPWPRSIHAEMLEAIAWQQPKAVVFDILFSDPDLTRPADDAYFMEVVQSFDNLYFPMLLLDNWQDGVLLREHATLLGVRHTPRAIPDARVSLVLPLNAMLQHGHLGTHNIYADSDGVVRRYRVYSDLAGWQMPSLPAKVAETLGYALPVLNNIRLHWHGPALRYTRISYADFYLDHQRRQPARASTELKDKIVIIGATATGLHDVRATPVDGFYPGVEILATAIDNFKHGDHLVEVNPLAVWLAGSLLLAGMACLFLRQFPLLYLGIALVAVTVLSMLAAYWLLWLNYLLMVLAPLLAIWVYYLLAVVIGYLRERRAREVAIAAFGRFLDPRVVRALVDSGQTIESMRGKRSEVTVLFSDIRGFTTMSERATPEEIVTLLNAYFGLQSEAIFAHQGTLDKYIGDAIMAFWGAPVVQPDHAIRAVMAALEMSERLETFKRDHADIASEIEIGIGVHSGTAVVGFIGSDNRLDYTAIGDTVNLSSRIEGLTKGVARILVSRETRDLCLQQTGNCPVRFVDHGSYQVKGREQPVQLFEPVRITAGEE